MNITHNWGYDVRTLYPYLALYTTSISLEILMYGYGECINVNNTGTLMSPME